MKSADERLILQEPVQAAVTELIGLMQQRFPTATFAVRRGTEDPDETFIMATVDLEDPDDLLTPILDRLLNVQLEEGLPVYVVPVHTPERIAGTRRRIASQRSRRAKAAVSPSSAAHSL